MRDGNLPWLCILGVSGRSQNILRNEYDSSPYDMLNHGGRTTTEFIKTIHSTHISKTNEDSFTPLLWMLSSFTRTIIGQMQIPTWSQSRLWCCRRFIQPYDRGPRLLGEAQMPIWWQTWLLPPCTWTIVCPMYALRRRVCYIQSVSILKAALRRRGIAK